MINTSLIGANQELKSRERISCVFGCESIYSNILRDEWYGQTFVDNFTVNSLHTYTIIPETNAGGTFTSSCSYDYTNKQVSIDTDDNVGLTFLKRLNNSMPQSGVISLEYKKTKDYPSDNWHYIYVYNKQDPTTYYHIRVGGSNYTSTLEKVVGGTITDSFILPYNLDDEVYFHTFDFRFSPTNFKFYADGVLISTEDTIDISDIICDTAEIRFFQMDLLLKKISIQEA